MRVASYALTIQSAVFTRDGMLAYGDGAGKQICRVRRLAEGALLRAPSAKKAMET